ncbi:unnamed protein product, partial [Polarella glacialis]
ARRHASSKDSVIAGLAKGGAVVLFHASSEDLSDYYSLEDQILSQDGSKDGSGVGTSNGKMNVLFQRSCSFHTVTSLKSMDRRSARTLQKQDTTKDQFVHEIRLLRQMDHPNIAKLYEVFEDAAQYHLVIECSDMGSLSEVILSQKDANPENNLVCSEIQVSNVMKQILVAVLYMHGHMICHRDLRPKVIMLHDIGQGLDTCLVRVVDMSSAYKMKKHHHIHGLAGRLEWSAPELLAAASTYGKAVDMWASGCIMHSMLCGSSPFGGQIGEHLSHEEEIEVQGRIQRGDLPEQQWLDSRVSRAAVKLLKRMLCCDESKRCTPHQATFA